MAENDGHPECENGAALKEAVCIDAMRIYDSCSDKDCLEDLRVLFPAAVQPLWTLPRTCGCGMLM